MEINDGTGSGRGVKVDNLNRMRTYSVTKPEEEVATLSGNKYNLNTGDITLTSANASGVFYLKNNDDNGDIVIQTFIFLIGNTTGGTAGSDFVVDIYRNPTTGTLISGASAVEMNQNANFGSAKTLTVDAYKGAEGNTVTNGNRIISSRIASSGRHVISVGSFNIPKGSTVAVTITPKTSNTNCIVQLGISCFLRSLSVSGD